MLLGLLPKLINQITDITDTMLAPRMEPLADGATAGSTSARLLPVDSAAAAVKKMIRFLQKHVALRRPTRAPI